MRHFLIAGLAVATLAVGAMMPAPVEARGGLNASYARAYCMYYLNMAAMAARSSSHRALAADGRTRDAERRSPEYWRQVYRDCLKKNGY